MNILINCSNLKNGGGLQVADSICGQLHRFPQHQFVVVLSTFLVATAERIKDDGNVTLVTYNIPDTISSIVLGRDKFMDDLVKQHDVKVVLTVFGPSRWRPRVPHLCGFARAQLLKEVNPNVKHNLKEKLVYKVWLWGFRKSSNIFYTENPYISDMLPKLIKGAKVYSVSNYYNQVFDHPEQWSRKIKLPQFQGTTMITISSTAAHKNLGIMMPIAEYLEKVRPGFDFRFVLTCSDAPFQLSDKLKKHFMFVGKVDVSECPNLYEQADIMFMPTLMECFTATYPEAMRMEVPIVTTDLEFAHGLCGEAACYYSAVDAKAAAESIYKVAMDKAYRLQLTARGKKQLQKFDNYEQRAEKLIRILEDISKQ